MANDLVAGAFARLHTGIQRKLWSMRWTELRPIQVEAIHAVLDSPDPVILAAATASGKTEAAFLPALSLIADDSGDSVRILYVSPLKALINDQFQRVEDLCEKAEIPVYRWHGDVARTQKHKVLKDPGGVLLITPESLESLLVNHGGALGKVFGGLRVIVLDELHGFLDNCRGQHLRSLLSRIQTYVGKEQPVRLIALSATLGDFEAAKLFLSRDHPDSVRVIEDHGSEREIKLKIHGYRAQPLTPEILAATVDLEPEFLAKHATDIAMGADILRHAAGGAALIFANSKADVELAADLCSRLAPKLDPRADIRVHHGSLSSEIREETEEILKEGKPVITFCSSTLELGIDIRSVKMAGQLGASYSVASQRQRLGRSGRSEGEPSVLRIYVECPDSRDAGKLVSRLQPELLQSFAVTELMLEKWVEPAHLSRYDFSTLAHQVISVISQTGGIPANELFCVLCKDGAFQEVDSSRFGVLLHELGARDIVEQMAEGELILGLKGEVIRKSRDYYAVFPTPEVYQLQYEGRVIGELEILPEENSHIVFAGKRWKVKQIDHEHKIVYLIPAHGMGRPEFRSFGGEVHPKIRLRMRDLLDRKDMPTFIDHQSADALSEARQAYSEAALQNRLFFSSVESGCLMFTWTGSRIHRTLGAVLRRAGLPMLDCHLAWAIREPEITVRKTLEEFSRSKVMPEELVEFLFPVEQVPKYLHLLGDELGKTQLAAMNLDLGGAASWIAHSIMN